MDTNTEGAFENEVDPESASPSYNHNADAARPGPKGEDVLGLLKKDFSAFDRRFRPVIIRVARTQGATKANAEDIAQNVLIELYGKRDQLPYLTKALIEKMARFRTRDHRNKSVHRHETTFGDRAPSDEDDRDPLQLLMDRHGTVATGAVESTITRLDLQRVRTQLKGLIGQLSARQRDVVAMAYFEDRPDAEIAAALGIKVSAVQKARLAAMKELRNFATGPQRKALRELLSAVSDQDILPENGEDTMPKAA